MGSACAYMLSVGRASSSLCDKVYTIMSKDLLVGMVNQPYSRLKVNYTMFKVDSHLLTYASFIMHFTSLICLLLHSPYIAKRRISLLLIKDPSVSHVSSFTFHFLKSFPTCFSVPVYLSLLSSSPTTHLIFLSTIICTFISIVVMLPHRMILFAPTLWRLRLPSSFLAWIWGWSWASWLSPERRLSCVSSEIALAIS